MAAGGKRKITAGLKGPALKISTAHLRNPCLAGRSPLLSGILAKRQATSYPPPPPMSIAKTSTIAVRGTAIAIITGQDGDYISLTDMLKAKDGEFFISDWLRNRNTVEFLGIWESVFNPDFNYGEFAIIKSQAGLNSYKISVKEWVEKTNITRLN